ncbi:PASTA domain-containing protein [Lactococcus ileimucosae]|uniref:PASTA domain-containing protein n=1 Tax=Lactococcus ileimucosae TaxID=2941329 RepID=A0ABV4D3R7_9LACT
MKKQIFNKVIIALVLLLSGIIIIAGLLGRQILFRDYPVFQSMSQKEIIETTNIRPDDNDYIKKLKNNALDVYLSNASSELAENLRVNEQLINRIINGEMSEEQFSQSQEQLQQALGASDEQMAQLSQLYENARLSRAVQELQAETETLKAEQLPQFIEKANQLAQQTEKSIQSYIEDDAAVSQPTIIDSIQTLNQANALLNNFTQFVNYTNSYSTINRLQFGQIATDNTLMEEFIPVFNKVNTYLSKKETVEARIKELTAFQKKVEKSEQLKASSVVLPNLRGKTLAEARKIAQTDFQIKVPTQFEDKDTAIITQQSPNPSDYARIMKGQTVTVQTQEKEKTGSKTDDKTEANNNNNNDDEDKNKGEEK